MITYPSSYVQRSSWGSIGREGWETLLQLDFFVSDNVTIMLFVAMIIV